MNVARILLQMEELARWLDGSVTVNVEKEWSDTLKHVSELEAEAVRLQLPINNVKKETARFRNSIGSVLGKIDDLGHDRRVHLSWALGSIWGLKSDDCFASVLVAQKEAQTNQALNGPTYRHE